MREMAKCARLGHSPPITRFTVAAAGMGNLHDSTSGATVKHEAAEDNAVSFSLVPKIPV
jgi:hypothetical protein